MTRATPSGRRRWEAQWEALLRRYGDEGDVRVPARSFRWSVALVATALARLQHVRFPQRTTGGWWWGPRWRLEWLLSWNEWSSVQHLAAALPPGGVCVDVGAHIGYYTRLAASLVGSEGVVLAVEPHPENLEILRHNTRGRTNVVVAPLAVGAAPGRVALWESPGSSNHSLHQDFVGATSSLTVDLTTVDDLVRAHGLTRVDLVKLDLEGGEPAAVEGMQQLLAQHRPVLLVESNARALEAAGSSTGALLELLVSHGYDVREVGDDRSLLPPDPVGTVLANWLCRPVEAVS